MWKHETKYEIKGQIGVSLDNLYFIQKLTLVSFK